MLFRKGKVCELNKRSLLELFLNYLLFFKGYPQGDFEKHVNSHFPAEN